VERVLLEHFPPGSAAFEPDPAAVRAEDGE
jgi:hypothetical protein